MKVKGTAIVDLIRIIRKEKSRNWDQYLDPEDMKLINSLILPTAWYSGDSFWRISRAVAKEIGEFKDENMILFGRTSAKSYMAVYKHGLCEGDPLTSIKRFVASWDSFYDFEGAPFEKTEVEEKEGSIVITAHDYPDMLFQEMRKPYFYGLAGYYVEIAAQALGREVTKMQIADMRNRHVITITI